MAKGDDVKLRKKNKANRKKLAKDPSAVSARVAGLIAAKKRRQSGKRRNCQGMCFSLPTPEDPYNERHGKADISTSKRKRVLPPQTNKGTLKNSKERIGDDVADQPKANRLKRLKLENSRKFSADNLKKEQKMKLGNGVFKSLGTDVIDGEYGTLGIYGCPSKFLCSCLNSIRDSLLSDGMLNKEEDKPLFVDSWGVEFWKSYSAGMDILENSGNSPSVQQMAWIASTAADSMSQKEKDGVSFTSPFLLYLVPSQEKANTVRFVCKPLKAFGIHTVSVHPGTSIEHQIQGLKSCEPEFLIATPERLKELVSLRAVDVSGVSLLVVDGMDSLSHCLGAVKYIKKSINGHQCLMAFQGHSGEAYVKAAKSILKKPFHTLSLDEQ